MEATPYPFGYGLSYTTFAYDNVRTGTGMVNVTAQGITVSADVTNTGSMEGGEAVQVYVKILRDGTPNAQLKGIRKIYLKPGETAHVQIHLPAEAFGLYDEDGIFRICSGKAEVSIGGSGPDARSEALTGRKVQKLTVTIPEYM